MTGSKIIIKGNITGNNHHFGDNFVYGNYTQYIQTTEADNLTETEKELVKIIFENTQDEAERRKILDSLIAIKKDSITVESEQKDTLSRWAKLLSYTKKLSNEVAVKSISTFIAEIVQHKWPHLQEFWTTLIK